ncbi:hypothetical protein [Caulobacter hibisci]|uniref:Uncharacterized protein n=1 Tax=Caulobacter hibisci TaxID=2035993 RepID=A0ABS0T375_9CAUL|nr:hypothetical protein [Caulobacter hibisci]MBI1685348.1 hypothetical protein [Caulobacter hibisci]
MLNALASAALALPLFCLAIFNPLFFPFSLLPAAGTACLVMGVIGGVRQRAKALLLFLIPVILSHILLFAAVLDGPRMQVAQYEGFDDGRWDVIGPLFLVAQLALCGWAFSRARAARRPAVLLLSFTLLFALFAGVMTLFPLTN